MATEWKNNIGSGQGGFTPSAHLWELIGTPAQIASWELQNDANSTSQRRQVLFGGDYVAGASLRYTGTDATNDAACDDFEAESPLTPICDPSHGVQIQLAS